MPTFPEQLLPPAADVVFGLFRYLQLLHRHDVGEEPENVLLGDTPILATVAAWAALCAVILIL